MMRRVARMARAMLRIRRFAATRQRLMFAFVLPLAVAACTGNLLTDAATRVANDVETGANALRHSGAQTLVVDHTPQATPDGCPGGYTLQFIKDSLIGVWCQEKIGGPSVSSHVTTYHLNFVTVPKTWIVHKDRGQHALIELSKRGDRIEVTDVR